MAEQEHKHPRRSEPAREAAAEPVVPRDVGGELTEKIDGLLDEFVRDYVQKGGQ